MVQQPARPFLSLFAQGRITFSIPPGPKERILEQVLDLAVHDLDLGEEARVEILQALLQRERAGSTAVGRIAIPHVKHRLVPRTVGAVAVFPSGLDFHAVDAEPVVSLFLVLSPEGAAEEHLNTLRWIATLARQKDYVRFVRQARTPQEVAALLEELGS